ncbi:MAG: lytic transglycosylase [Rhodobacterales bacterium 12-65-15]|nr:MAG: lytic transglycosylase [Rhodobacterales bacterium 12-65-15]
MLAALAWAGPVLADSDQAMRTALELTSGRDYAGALAVAPAGVGVDIVEWQRLRAGQGSFAEYEGFLARHPDWPGLPLMYEKAEGALAETADPTTVIGWFSANPAVTGTGAVAHVTALLAAGRIAEAETEAMRAWASLAFTPEEEAALLALQPEAVEMATEARLDILLWTGRTKEAERLLPRLPEDLRALARARIALQTEASGVNALIDLVPEARADDAGLAYDRFIWRMRRDLYDDALALILDRSSSAERLGQPEAWAERRAILTRWLLRQGRPAEAYKVAAANHLEAGADYADLEFLAGFIALRRLDDPATAEAHFQRLLAAVRTPISLARGHYWIGRAVEASGRDATASYQAAAQHQTAFYGLLAAERLGRPLDEAILSETLPDWTGAAFATTSVFEAAVLLRDAGDPALARRFLLSLAEGQDATGLAQMADMALDWNDPNLAVLIGKAAAERGLILHDAYYPVPDIVPDGLSVSRALALAIARRESEFDPTARSSADARGLMQVLPGTAKLMAKKLGIDFDAARLTTDPAYNVELGAAYLAEMADEFGPSIALIASGYNAGPGRPRNWIEEFGDPRLPDVDIVDWVEMIPFSETRTYVMRVAEGVVLYRAKLKGEVGPVRITAELKG